MTDLQKRLSEVFGYTGGKWYKVGRDAIYRRPEKELYEFGGGVAGDKPLVRCFQGWAENGYNKEANAILISKAPEMLEILWDATIKAESLIKSITNGKTPETKEMLFFLSLYQEIHGESITWEELKNKIEGVKND